MAVYLRTLGESVIEVGEVRIGPRAPHMFAALLYLALEAGRRVPRARLQELLFPTSDERSGSHSLRQLLYRLRRVGVELDADSTGVLLRIERVTADFQSFLTPGEALRGDLSRLSGGLLPGFSPTFSEPFAEWLDQRRSELHSDLRRTLTADLVNQRAQGRWAAMERTARAILALDSLNEEATLALAEATALSGSKLEAVRLLDSYLQEVGSRDGSLRVPAAVLKRRIAERLPGAVQAPGAPFVGRQTQLALLADLLSRAVDGDGSACHIWGESGIGKTRLVSEFARAAALRGARVEYVNSQPHDVRRPMGAFSDLIPALLRLPGALGCSPEAIALLTKLFKFGGEGDAALSPDVREAELLSANITRAISELLDAVAAESTVVVVLEDAQWLDPISRRVVADLVAERKCRAFLVVLTSRDPSVGLAGPAGDRLRSLRLQALQANESRLLLGQLLSTVCPGPEHEFVEWCLNVAAGNPFFLHSLAAHYVATRDLTTIPEPLSALLSQRLDRLDRSARRVFEACSVLGPRSTFDRLEAVLGVRPLELLDGLQVLEDHGLIRTEGPSVVSTHALLSDVALNSTPCSVRSVLHRNAARTLEEELTDGGPASLLWECAEHWLQGGDKRRAFAALRTCARHALEIGRPHDACNVLIRAAASSETLADHMAMLEELILAADIGERWSIVAESVRTYIRLAAHHGSPIGRYHEYRILELEASMRSGADPKAVLEPFRQYLHDAAAPITLRVRAATGLMVLAEDLMSLDLATEAFDAISRARVKAGEQAPDRFRLDLIYHTLTGRFTEAIAIAQRGVRESGRSVPQTCRRLHLAGFALLRAGRLEEGSAALKDSYSRAHDADLHCSALHAAVSLACLYRDMGCSEDAAEWHARATEAAAQEGTDRQSLNHFANCILFAIDRSDFAAAGDWLRRTEEIAAARSGYPGLIFRALDIRLKQLSHNYDCSDEELQALLNGHFEARGVGHHDEVVVTLWHALSRKGRVAYADTLLQEYLHLHRCLRWPLCPDLRDLAHHGTAEPHVGSDLSSPPGRPQDSRRADSARRL